MKRFGCFGSCLDYDLIIQQDTKIIIQRTYIENFDVVGRTEYQMTDEKLKQLISEIEKANFFSFEDAYINGSTDCRNSVKQKAGVILYIKLNGKEKTITHYFGCRLSEQMKDHNPANIEIENDLLPEVFPLELYNLEKKIDEIGDTKRWLEKENKFKQ